MREGSWRQHVATYSGSCRRSHGFRRGALNLRSLLRRRGLSQPSHGQFSVRAGNTTHMYVARPAPSGRLLCSRVNPFPFSLAGTQTDVDDPGHWMTLGTGVEAFNSHSIDSSGSRTGASVSQSDRRAPTLAFEDAQARGRNDEVRRLARSCGTRPWPLRTKATSGRL